MELVFLLLAGFLSLAEGQSEWVCLMIVTCCSISSSFPIQMYIIWIFNTNIINQNLKSFPLTSLYIVCSVAPLPFDCEEAYVLGCSNIKELEHVRHSTLLVRSKLVQGMNCWNDKTW